MSTGKKWQCTVCGLTQEGQAPPKNCPKCGVDSSKFIGLRK